MGSIAGVGCYVTFGIHPTTNNAVQIQKAVSAYFTSEQILPFGLADQNLSMAWSACVMNYYVDEPVFVDKNNNYLHVLFSKH